MKELEVLIGLVLAATVLAAVARRVGAPYPVFLALGGAILAFVPGAPSFTVLPELALALFVAPVLLDAAYDASGRVVLQHPEPGTRGTLGQRVIEGPGQWRFDANLQKSFRISESKSLQFRMDARNILNHPELNAPSFAISAANFGTINGKTNLRRQFQAQLRLSF